MKAAGRILAIALGCVALQAPALLAAAPCEDRSAFLFELELFLDHSHDAVRALARRDPTRGELLGRSIADFEARLQTLSAPQLDALCELFRTYSDLASAPARLTEQLEILPARDSGAPEAGCLTLTRAQFVAAFTVAQTFKVTAIALQTTCEATECISLACKITCALAGVANGLVLPLDAVLEESAYCADDAHVTLVEGFRQHTAAGLGGILSNLALQVAPPLDRPVSSIASQASADAVQAAAGAAFTDLGGQVASVAADLAAQEADRAEFREAALRQHVEANLRPGEPGRISLLQLPRSVGGLLEDVREVVAGTIQANQAAGFDVGGAVELFQEGDLLFNQGVFKAAFRHYREAYRDAVGEEPRDGETPSGERGSDR